IHYVKDADSDICEEIELSDGTFNYKPIVDESEKTKIGSEYSTIDKCIKMYAKYAEKSRFTIRKSTQENLKSGIPARKYLLCKKEGFPKGYVLYEFEEAHNHTFVPKAYRNLTKKRKQMSHLNATEIEYQNHKRDLNAHIGEGDAQMLITKMNNRKLHVDNFSFEYVVENIQLSVLFWADEMSKYSYKEFGDTISFDATFRTNKYNMVFAPFTGIDNHRKCVTFGAAAIERQRHRQEILDDSTMQKIPRFKTKLPIERFAQKKYTKTMFTLIQEEINLAISDCHQISESLENRIETVTIK
nr:hypothetical protein [Tanacetum cinerariifolium]